MINVLLEDEIVLAETSLLGLKRTSIGFIRILNNLVQIRSSHHFCSQTVVLPSLLNQCHRFLHFLEGNVMSKRIGSGIKFLDSIFLEFQSFVLLDQSIDSGTVLRMRECFIHCLFLLVKVPLENIELLRYSELCC